MAEWKTQRQERRRQKRAVAEQAVAEQAVTEQADSERAVAEREDQAKRELALPRPEVHKVAVIDAHNECIDMFNAWVELGAYTPEERKYLRESHLPITKSFFTWAYCSDHGRHLVELRYWRDYMGVCQITYVDGEVESQRW